MKFIIYSSVAVMMLLQSCSGGTYYHLDADDKAKQRGYHANEANKIIDKNEANRKTNQKAAEQNRQAMNEHAKSQAKSKKAVGNDGSFKFY